jgi:hypothetical protein
MRAAFRELLHLAGNALHAVDYLRVAFSEEARAPAAVGIGVAEAAS